MKHEKAFARLMAEVDDYREFLRHGHVGRLVKDPDVWRRDLRRKARRDHIPFRSFAEPMPGGLWHATALNLAVLYAEDTNFSRRREAQEVVEDAAKKGQHDLLWHRVYGAEAAGYCTRCGARAYANAATTPFAQGGEVIERACS